MNFKLKKTIFWSMIFTTMVLGLSLLIGGYRAFAHGPHGHGPGGMGLRGGDFGGRHMMQGPHYGGGFSWLTILVILIIGIVILMITLKWVRRKTKVSSMQQFIDTSLMTSYKPTLNNQESFLDQWEKQVINKKENE